MKKSILPLLFLFIATNLCGQSIIDIRNSVYEKYNLKYGIPRKITETETIFRGAGFSEYKEIIEFSDKLDTMKVTSFWDREIHAQRMYVFNDNHQEIFSAERFKVPLADWEYCQSVYFYDKNGLAEIKTISLDGELVKLFKVRCDSLGNPTRLEMYDSKLKLIGFETGDYDYENNKWIHRIFRSNGSLCNKREIDIEEVMPTDAKYNKQGDCILYPCYGCVKNNTYHKVEYEYDDLGNWTEMMYYTIHKINGKFRNREKNVFHKRIIEYQN